MLLVANDSPSYNGDDSHMLQMLLLRIVKPLGVSKADGGSAGAKSSSYNTTSDEDESVLDREFMVEEEHLIPLVESIVPRIDMEEEKIFVDPPDGLLDLGRRKAQLDLLKQKLDPVAKKFALERGGSVLMPTRRELENTGRKDLIKAISKAGGFLEVAQALNYRSKRRPPGYWEDETILDRELSLFVSAHWVQFNADINPCSTDTDSNEDSDDSPTYSDTFTDYLASLRSGEFEGPEDQPQETDGGDRHDHSTMDDHSTYWYNTVTRRMRWSPPVLPQLVELDDEGCELFTETEEDRAMPSRSALLAAGRYDLHSAIVAAGGYQEVAMSLDRWPAWPPTARFKNISILKEEIEEFISEHDLPKTMMPTASDFLDLGRPDLHQGVLKGGGYSTAAEILGFKSHRKKRGSWKDFEALCNDIKRYATLKANKTGTWPRMPTHEELRTSGHHDLRHALQKHGSRKISEATGLPLSRQGGKSRRNKQFQEQLQEDFGKWKKQQSDTSTGSE